MSKRLTPNAKKRMVEVDDGNRPSARTCRFCGSYLSQTFVDLGMSPLANSYIRKDSLHEMEPFYPLHVFVCRECLLVQLEEFASPQTIFEDYAYFSSYSDSWLEHARQYVDFVVQRFSLGPRSHVVEIASNDGYLLRNFFKHNIPVLGIEPAENVAKVAKDRGIPTIVKFFGVHTAKSLAVKRKQADLLIGNNVLAHVPDINDFIAGLKIALRPHGVITMEFPHLMRLLAENQFDTIYHEHFSYLSLLVVERMFGKHGLALFDVEELPTHGGSLRIYGKHSDDSAKSVSQRLIDLREREASAGLHNFDRYVHFARQVSETKQKLLSFLIEAKREGKSIAGYGAPAKGNTLLNYCGIRTDFLDYTVDRSPHKQGLYLPGVRVPILEPDAIKQTRPDYVLILPWNIREEVMKQMAFIRDWGGRFVVPIPEVKVFT